MPSAHTGRMRWKSCFLMEVSVFPGFHSPPHQSAAPPASPQGEAFVRQNPPAQQLKQTFWTVSTEPHSCGSVLIYIVGSSFCRNLGDAWAKGSPLRGRAGAKRLRGGRNGKREKKKPLSHGYAVPAPLGKRSQQSGAMWALFPAGLPRRQTNPKIILKTVGTKIQGQRLISDDGKMQQTVTENY